MIRRGDLYWFDFGVPRGSVPGYRRPIVVIQNDIANQSAIRTTIVGILTTNLRLARARGNVLLTTGEGNLCQQSVVNVSQVTTVNKSDLSDESFTGMLAPQRMDQINSGLRLFL